MYRKREKKNQETSRKNNIWPFWMFNFNSFNFAVLFWIYNTAMYNAEYTVIIKILKLKAREYNVA